jgi:acyl dehydratase
MQDGSADVFLENRTFDELTLGETASLSHTVTQRDIDLFAIATGDVNPAITRLASCALGVLMARAGGAV